MFIIKHCKTKHTLSGSGGLNINGGVDGGGRHCLETAGPRNAEIHANESFCPYVAFAVSPYVDDAIRECLSSERVHRVQVLPVKYLL